MPLELPQELIDEIIDHLYDDIPSLASCSLACHRMLHRSRVHKLAHIIITSSRTRPELQPLEAKATQYVHHLTVEGTVYLPLAIFKCTDIHWLSLYNVSFQWFHRHSLASLFPFPALDRLELRGCRFLDKSSIAHFLCGFPKLASIIVPGRVGWPKKTEIINDITTCRPLSGHLNIEHTDMARFIDMLSSLHNGTRFNIQLSCLAQHIGNINELLKACGSGLEKLNITHLPWAQADKPGLHILTSPNPEANLDIRSDNNVRRRIPFEIRQFSPQPQTWILQSLSPIPFSCLQRVDLHCAQIKGQLAIEPLDWEELDVMLSRSRFSNLKKVRVFCLADTEPSIELPRLKAQGILEVVAATEVGYSLCD